MPQKRTFINQFLKNKKMIGSVRPSSRFLTEKMLQNIDFKNCKTLVELGPGTGVFTYKILDKMAPDAKLLIFELNEDFYNILKKNITDNRVIIIHDSAEKIEEHLLKNKLETADVIISSLPLSNFPKEVRDSIISTSFKTLSKNGKYIQFQYSIQSKKIFETIFNKVSISFTPLNLPPAFIYTCEK